MDFCEHEFVLGVCRKCRIPEYDVQPGGEMTNEELKERARERADKKYPDGDFAQYGDPIAELVDCLAAFASSIQEEAGRCQHFGGKAEDCPNAGCAPAAKLAEKEQQLAEARSQGTQPDGRWLIWFHDTEARPELFVGEGAEVGARARFAALKLNWNCHLFAEVIAIDRAGEAQKEQDMQRDPSADGRRKCAAREEVPTAGLQQTSGSATGATSASAGVASDGWIKCSERLPEPGSVVLVYCMDADDSERIFYQDIASYSEYGGWCVGMDAKDVEVSHWHELLANPPKREE